MERNQMIGAFNEWMRQYTENPKAFEAEFLTVGDFLAARAEGREPTYGEKCTALLEKLAAPAVAA